MSYIEYELAQLLLSTEAPTIPSSGRVSRQLKHFPITPEVDIQPDNKGHYVLSVVAGDRPGLLARIAQVLARHKIELHNAKINTLGARAEDTFLVSGTALNQPHTAASLREALLRQIS